MRDFLGFVMGIPFIILFIITIIYVSRGIRVRRRKKKWLTLGELLLYQGVLKKYE